MKGAGTFLLTLILGAFSVPAVFATSRLSDGTAASVQYLHDNSAQEGDTITLPAGTFTWTVPVTISKAIRLKGAGSGRIIGNTKSSAVVGTGLKTFATARAGLPITAGQVLRIAKMPGSPGSGQPARGTYMQGIVTSYSGTTLVMNITSTGGSGTWRFWWIATMPATTVVNAYQGNGNSYDGMLRINQSQNGHTEVSGIRFLASAHKSSFVSLYASAWVMPKTLIHDCWFENDGGGVDAIFAASNQGLVWNCSFDDTWSQAAAAITLKWEFGAGDVSWRTNSTMGTNDLNGATNFYVEDCDFHGYLGVADFDSNSRVVFRHNLLDNSSISSHGADTGPIGLRHVEIYDNELIFDNFGDCDGSLTLPVPWFFWLRGGTGVITNNVLPALSSCAWGNKGNIVFSVLNTRRSSGPYCCWGTYPAPHQVGQGFGPGAVYHQYFPTNCWGQGQNFSYYTRAEPVYVWSNSGTGGNRVSLNQDDTDECGNGQNVASYVLANRDYVIAPKPGYQKFTYPHPLATSLNRATLGNISTRSFVRTGDNVMIGGFIVQGTEPKTVIIRANGPSLTRFGIPDALADPTLELHDGTGALIASNYNWQTTHIGGIITADQVSAIQNSGYAPSQASESAIIATLPPGSYTAIVSGVNNTTGVALVDVYDLQ